MTHYLVNVCIYIWVFTKCIHSYDFIFPDDPILKNKKYQIVSDDCRAYPQWNVENISYKCKDNQCKLTCLRNYAFPNGDTQKTTLCKNGVWNLDTSTLYACKPICMSPCQNQGICVSPGKCACPENFMGPYCEKKKEICLSPPNLPKNSEIQIQASKSTITCRRGYFFPDKTSVANLECVDGFWKPTRSELAKIPDCEPSCNPICTNGGICISINVCQCPSDRRGLQCQYDKQECDPKTKLGFNGIYNCSGNSVQMQCDLSCPMGIQFSFNNTNPYTCLYELRKYLPDKIPQCLYPEGLQFSAHHETSEKQFSNSSENIYRANKSKTKKVYYESDDEDDDQSYEKIITKTKIEIKKRKKKPKKSHYYEIEQEETTDDESYLNDGMYSLYMTDIANSVISRIPKRASCITWNSNKVKTFDGLIYSSSMSCSHVLVQDTIDGLFSIIFKLCTNSKTCSKSSIEIIIENNCFTFELDSTGLNVTSLAGKITLPIQRREIRATMIGGKLKIVLESFGIIIYWDLQEMVTVEASEALWNRTAGLCGTMDNDITNDFKSKDGTIVKMANTFIDSWFTKSFNSDVEACRTYSNQFDMNINETYRSESIKKGIKICTDIVDDKRFKDCIKILNRESFVKSCVNDYYTCHNNQESCVCNAAAVLASDCQFRGINFPDGWRNFEICPVTCSNEEVFRPCGPVFEPYCGSTSNEINTECKEGCFCPDGMVRSGTSCVRLESCTCSWRGKQFKAMHTIKKDCNTCQCKKGMWECSNELCGSRCSAIGDPHYQTFDNKRYDFMGKCAYVLLKNDKVIVESENAPCSQDFSRDKPFELVDKPSCTKSVTIKFVHNFDEITIRLKQGRTVLVNDVELVKLPSQLFNGKVVIREASSFMLHVLFNDGLLIWWDGSTNLYIDAPSSYRNSTSGLCGTFNSNQQDDFLTYEGDVESSVSSFANKWRTKDTCEFINEQDVPHPCHVNIERKNLARQECDFLKSTIFSECHWHIDPDDLYNDCLYDVCACEYDDIGKCLCPIVSAYASQCSQQGVVINWRNEIGKCDVKCPNGQIFEECGDSCYRSCADSQFDEKCKKSCVEGCRCPNGQSLNSDGECILSEECPCIFDGVYFDAGYREVRSGRKHLDLCTCVGAKWNCIQANDQDSIKYPPYSEQMKLCQNDNNSEFRICKSENPKSCKNMEHYTRSNDIYCENGCDCKSDFVLDPYTKLCIKPEDCGCHHGGKSYNNGHSVHIDCNECICSNASWTCTKHDCPATCSAWGDSHFQSFDGKQFDFQGVCSFVLSKGSLDNGDSYAIIIQNVLCGSYGVTCSKSVTISILGINMLTIELSSDVKMITPSDPRMQIYDVGIFTIVELVGMDVQIKWDGGTRVYIKTGAKWRNHVQGLCGNYNGNAEDDLKTPSSGVEASSTIFGNSWKLEEYCEKPQNQVNTCEKHPERHIWSERQCAILKSSVFQQCHLEVPVDRYMRDCVHDACACDQGGDCECLCTAVAAYAYACSLKGLAIKWRTPTLCPMQCDIPTSQYTECLQSSCPIETCDKTVSTKSEMCIRDTCIEGCQISPCAFGSIYTNNSYVDCVPAASCRQVCKVDGNVIYYDGDILFSDECQTCRCFKGKPVCIGIPCTSNNKIPSILPPSQPILDEEYKCIEGWSSWVNQDTFDAKKIMSKYKFDDIEPVPDQITLNNLSVNATCPMKQINEIQCRSVSDQKDYKLSGEDVECSLERGLIARGLVQDYEIRVYCKCNDNKNASANNNTTQYKSEKMINLPKARCQYNDALIDFPGDCKKYLQCVNQYTSYMYVEQICSPGTLFNPITMICDWPNSVYLIKPECKSVESTTEKLCKEMEIPCNRTCHFYNNQLKNIGLCNHNYENLSLGCKTSVCGANEFMRDDMVCTDSEHCTCATKDGQMLKPGSVYMESSCQACQCIHNEYVCDSSQCELNLMTTTNVAISNNHVLDDIIFTSTVSPPHACKRSRMYPIIEQMPNIVFNASSIIYLRRSNNNNSGLYWKPDVNDKMPYLKIKLPNSINMYGIMISGNFKTDNFVTSYRVIYSNDDIVYHPLYNNEFNENFRGPIDGYNPVDNIFNVPIEASTIKLYPLTWHKEIELYINLLGCDYDYKKTYLVSENIKSEPICKDDMGISNGLITNNQLEVSSRLDSRLGLGEIFKFGSENGWQPKLNTKYEYVIINFLEPRLVTGVKTTGGINGWVTGFVVAYSLDKIFWSTIEDGTTNMPQIFLGNFDTNSIKTNIFEYPLNATYLKIMPIKWHEIIELKIEPIGCYKPYPLVDNTINVTDPTPQCNECPGAEYKNDNILDDSSCTCEGSLYWSGSECVPKNRCPCVVDKKSYAIGVKFLDSFCSECTCLIGGYAKCANFTCPACKEGLRSRILDGCKCICEPCGEGETLCNNGVCIPTSSLCNGIQDCSNDESQCIHSSLKPETNYNHTICSQSHCQYGYKVQYVDTTNNNLNSSSICNQYECINDDTSLLCSQPVCPKGYKITYETYNNSKKCPKYTCTIDGNIDGVCTIKRTMFTTFDGISFKYDYCNHYLVDFDNKNWSIAAVKKCEQKKQCQVSIQIYEVMNVLFEITNELTIKLNGFVYDVNQIHLNSFDLKLLGNAIEVKSKWNDFWLIFDKQQNVKIGVKNKHMGMLGGLCGFYNGNQFDDKQKPSRTIASTTQDFADSWKVNSESCENRKCTKDLSHKAVSICNSINSTLFTNCSTVVEYNKYMEECLEYTCDCLNSDDSQMCKCNALETYVKECLKHNNNNILDLKKWRSMHGCQKDCPSGMTFKECSKQICESTCNNMHMNSNQCTESTDNSCISGCFCEYGKVQNGDACIDPSLCDDCVCKGFGPVLLTYDMQDVHLNGNCTTLLTSNALLQFQVFATLGLCENKVKPRSSPSLLNCVREIFIISNEHKVSLSKYQMHMNFTLDGNQITFKNNYKLEWIELEIKDKYIYLYLPKHSVHIEISFDMLLYSIQVPRLQNGGNNLQGFCANCNNDPSDDIKLGLESLKFQSIHPFEKNSCIVSNNDTTNNIICSVQEKYPNTCEQIGKLPIFTKCYNLIDPSTFVKICQSEICENGIESKRALCKAIEYYMNTCNDIGICMEWPKDVCEEPIQCSPGQTFDPCGCPRTCENGAIISDCKKKGIMSCVCPQGQVLRNNTCVLETNCMQCDVDGHIVGETWNVDKCTKCTCITGGQKICTTKECPKKECRDGFYIVDQLNNSECCTSYICKPYPETIKKCNDTVNSVSCSKNQIVSIVTDQNGCTKQICECMSEDHCPKVNELIPKLGESITTEIIDCCRVKKIVCNQTNCPKQSIQCEYPYHPMEVQSQINCCPEYECRLINDICVYKVNGTLQIKKAYEEWTSNNVCILQNCNYDSSGKAQITEKKIQCENITCNKGWSKTYDRNVCCPYCKQTQCIYENSIIDVNTTIHQNNCTKIKCIYNNGLFQITKISESCPDISECDDHLRYKDGCCLKCKPKSLISESNKCIPNKIDPSETIHLIAKQTTKYGLCKNTIPVMGLAECKGNCESGTKFNRSNFKQLSSCKCCQVKEYSKLYVPLECESGNRIEIIVNTPKVCSCQGCNTDINEDLIMDHKEVVNM